MGKKGRKDSKSWKTGRRAAQWHLLATRRLEVLNSASLHWVCTRVSPSALRLGWTRGSGLPLMTELFAATLKKTEESLASVVNPLVSPSGSSG